jgi:phosphotransferase system, enzyme I, PtsP
MIQPTNPTTHERLGLSTLEDISKLILQSSDLDETLRNIVELVAARMRTEVCSIYLYENEYLNLRATIGLSPSSVGLSLAVGEGLIGFTAETRAVVNVDEPQNHPRFKYVENSNEDKYHSFLGIPLYDRHQLIGVMAIQTIEPRQFDEIEISTLGTIAFQLSTVVASARLLERINLEQSSPPTQREVTSSVIKGNVGFHGVASGPAILINETYGFAEVSSDDVVDIEQELEHLTEALEKSRIETLCLEKRVAERLSEDDAAIFHSHLMMLQDRALIDRMRACIQDGASAASSVRTVIADYVAVFQRMDDPYLRERAIDMEDIGRRLISNLLGDPREGFQLSQPGILIAGELMPSDVAMLDPLQILGLVLESGDSNSHAVIIAKSLGIPALIGVKDALRLVEPGTSLILDANSGCLHISPSPQVRREYQRLEADGARQREELEQFKNREAETADGIKVILRANIGLLSDIKIAHRYGAEGVGLYRTEFPYMAHADYPDRQTQYDIYRRAVKEFPGQSVTIRTLDIGGDKQLPYFEAPQEENPFLGWRSVRISLDQRDIFQTQIEAILMAATHGSVKLMFPMITTIEEILACKAVVADARAALSEEGWTIPDVPLGMMIEVPAVITLAESFAAEVDFFALGTNDLVQYMLAADRGNARISHHYDPLHPAMLRAIRQIVDVTQRLNKGLCICGEMASDPGCFAVLVGLGLREFSVSSPAIFDLKSLLSKLTADKLQELTQSVLAEVQGNRIHARVDQLLKDLAVDSYGATAASSRVST